MARRQSPGISYDLNHIQIESLIPYFKKHSASEQCAASSEDEFIYELDLEGKRTIQLPPESVALQGGNEILGKLLGEPIGDQACAGF